MELKRPFIKLPFLFDAERLTQELAQLEESIWMAHPNRIEGNSAVPLISVGGGDNDEFSGSMAATPHLNRCEYTKQVMASFNEVLARSRLMRLSAGAQVSAHVDFNYHWYHRVRIHVPIITHSKVMFHCGGEQINMQAGECWIFDSWRNHNVVNHSNQDRIHLVIDTAGSSRFWEMVDRAVEQNDEAQFLDYQPGFNPALKTERFNVAPVMSPGELEAIANELTRDFCANSDNDPKIAKEYTRLLRNLAKDWREVWHQYGYTKSGQVHYQALLNRTVKSLRPNPRALVTASNGVGVNPIIMQRILRAALNVNQVNAFKE